MAVKLKLREDYVIDVTDLSTFESGVTLLAPYLKKVSGSVMALKINGVLADLTTPIEDGVSVEVVTTLSPEGLDILRHDGAHLLAQAVKRLFPDVQVTIGPSIENGFYYDFYCKEPFSEEDFAAIEAEMRRIVEEDIPIEREVWDKDQAIAYFKERGEKFKCELIEAIDPSQEISMYRQGEFMDLCRGPHLPSTRTIGTHFKLMKVAGAYWRGDSKNPMLSRIYGTIWPDGKSLQQYLHFLELAKKRDHRRLGQEMHLFHFQDEARGSVFWHPRGWKLYQGLQEYIRRRLEVEEYQEVRTPELLDKRLWEASGHWDKFRDDMFVVTDENQCLALKPMSCPGHAQVFNQGIKSYKELPLRMSEFGMCHRNESSGALHGLMRVRQMVQDDGHIFCTPEQIISETKDFCELLKKVYADFGFTDVVVRFSDRPEKRAGADDVWDMAEESLREAVKAANLEVVLNPGEGAFYGPKLEFVLKDALGRFWQLGTLQVDFVLPERLDTNYVAEDGKKHRPVMLHRAIFGSFERFIGVLLEHSGGKLPFWLAPLQVKVLTVTQEADAYAQEISILLQSKGIRGEVDIRNEKISYKIREYSLQKIPILLILGQKEVEDRTVTLRYFGTKEQEVLSLDEMVAKLYLASQMPDIKK